MFLRLACVLATVIASTASQSVAAEGQTTFPRDFSPTASWVHDAERPARLDLCLNGRWQFQPVAVPAEWKSGTGVAPELTAPEADRWEATPIKIPSPWNINTWGGGGDVGAGTRRPYAPSSVYFPSYPAEWDGVRMGWLRRTIALTPAWKDHRVILHFEAIAGEARVLVNGTEVGRHFDQHLPVDFDITDALRPEGDNELLVGVRKAQLFNIDDARYGKMHFVLPLGSNTDQLVGIWQDVWLTGVPNVYVADAFVKPWVDRDRLEVEVTIANTSGKPVTTRIDGVIKPWINDAGTGVLDAPEPKSHLGDEALKLDRGSVQVPAKGTVTTTVSVAVKGRLKLWTPTTPNLYGAVLALDGSGDRKYVRFGWRQFGFRGRDLLLNGEKLQCVGDLLHPFGPFIESRRFAWGWYKMIKDVGGNAVRPHAQPWPRCYYDLADEMGLVVVAETGLFGSSIALNFAAPESWKNFAASFDRLVLRQRNNPSVVGWSFGNELFAIFRLNDVSPEDGKRWYAQLTELGMRAKALDPTRPWISCDGDEDLDGTLPVWSKHYGHNVPDMPVLDKPQMVGESGGTYYAAPKLMAEFNGDRSYESYAGRAEALGIDAYQNIVKLALPRLAYYSTSELAWFGIEHLPLGYSDFKRLPDRTDGVFPAKPYADGQPGMQLERIPPYVSTINPGWDPKLPLYRPLAMFDAMKAALAPGGPKPSKWDHRDVVKGPVGTPVPATIAKVGFAGDQHGPAARRLRSLGVALSEDAAAPLLVVDGLTAAKDSALNAHVDGVLAKGGTVVLLVGGGADQAATALFPAGITLRDREASQLVATAGDPLAAGFTVPSLAFFAAEKNPQVIKRVADGPGLKPALRPSNTDWSLFHRNSEVVKCAAMVLYEALDKPVGAVVGSVAHKDGRVVFITIDPGNAEQAVLDLWGQVFTNLGVKRQPPATTWLLTAAATPNTVAEWRYTTTDPGEGWTDPGFADGAWTVGKAGFGGPVPGVTPSTPWSTGDIWLRRVFTAAGKPDDATLIAYWDEDAEVFVNGVKIADLPGFTSSYRTIPLGEEALKPFTAGTNTVAVRCRNVAGGQFIDVGILLGTPANGAKQKAHDLLLDGPMGE